MYKAQIKILAGKLTEAGIKFELCPIWDGWQIIYKDKQDRYICDAVCHGFSFGHELEFLEIMGLTQNDDNVEGWLTAEEVFERINAHHIHQ